MGKPITWSFSALNDFTNCPLAYKLKRVEKSVPNIETEAMRYGTATHLFLENRVASKSPLPDYLSWMEPHIARLESTGAELLPEKKLALTKGLEPTGFFAKDVWVRSILDLTVRFETKSVVCDYKSGKRKFDSDQLMLFAGFEFADRPDIDEVRTGYVWLKDKAIDSETYTRKDIPMIWGHFMPKVERLERAYEKDEWPARSSGLCGWCSATKAQCKHAKG